MRGMGTLYLVRHGQASLGADDYDNLSDLGHKQSLRLGEYWRAKGLTFDAVLVGTLKRHTQTLADILEGMGLTENNAAPLTGPVPPLQWPGLNEYDSEAVIAALHPAPLAKNNASPERYRAHMRLLRDGLTQWMNGVTSPRGMAAYAEFVQGVTSALNHVRSHHDGNVLLVSSGGPIATAVGHVLGTTPETTIELNFRMRNASVTEFAFTPKRHMLVTFNALAHLDTPEHADWVTYA